MSLVGLFFDRRPRITGLASAIVFDAAISEAHAVEYVWTSEPVEDGSTISDNRWNKPVPLTITVIVSSSEQGGLDRSRHVRAWNTLLALAGAIPAQLFTITTTLRDYPNMGIQKISAPVSAETGDSLQATIVAVPILISNTAVAANLADAAQDSGQASVDLGNQGFAA